MTDERPKDAEAATDADAASADGADAAHAHRAAATGGGPKSRGVGKTARGAKVSDSGVQAASADSALDGGVQAASAGTASDGSPQASAAGRTKSGGDASADAGATASVGEESARDGRTGHGGDKAASEDGTPRAVAATATAGPETDPEDQPAPALNREQRRAQKFHRKSGGRQDNLHTQRENNSGFLTTPPAVIEEGPKEAVATSTTQGPTHLTGPGTGGATETGERAPHHEGAHQGNPTKG